MQFKDDDNDHQQQVRQPDGNEVFPFERQDLVDAQARKVIASTSGISLGAPPNDKEQIARLREAMGSVTENDLDRAAQIVDIYRGGGKNGKRNKQ